MRHLKVVNSRSVMRPFWFPWVCSDSTVDGTLSDKAEAPFDSQSNSRSGILLFLHRTCSNVCARRKFRTCSDNTFFFHSASFDAPQHKDTLYRACWSNFNFITFFLEFLRKKVSGNPTHVGIWCWFVTTLGIREFTRYLCGICGTRQTALGFPFPFQEVTF